MVEIKNISEMLKSFIEIYDFNKNTLSKYLEITVEQIDAVVKGNVVCLPEEHTIRCQILSKIGFLYLGAIEDNDTKLSGFLKILISYHNLSKNTIAKMAGVERSDIDRLLSTPPKGIDIETKYKIAVTVMGLRFLLKDSEPPMR